MAHANEYSNENYNAHIAKKKKLVNELLALRRMKYKQKLQEQRALQRDEYGFQKPGLYPLEFSRSKAEQERIDQAKKLLDGTVLEKEAMEIHGEEIKEEVIGHFVNFHADFTAENEGNEYFGNEPNSKREFMQSLNKKRKDKLEEKQQLHFDKEQMLLEKKKHIYEEHKNLKETAAKMEVSFQHSLPSYENKIELLSLVNETKQNIDGMQKSLKFLKLQNKTKQQKSKYYLPPAINYKFQPTQQEQVSIVKEIVNEIVDKTLNFCFGSKSQADSKLLEKLLHSDSDQYEKLLSKSLRHDAILVIIQELIIEISDEIILQIAEKFVYLHEMTKVMAVDLVINSAELVGGRGPRKSNDPKGKLVDQTWSEILGKRERSRKDIWAHSQSTLSAIPKVIEPVVNKTKKETVHASIPEREIVENEGDLEKLSYKYIFPKTEISGPLMGDALKSYSIAEYNWWEGFTPFVEDGPINASYSKIIGISCLGATYSHKNIAIGTYRGDIMVYNVEWEPFRPVRCVAFRGKLPDPIVSIKWSIDGSRLLTLSKIGNIIVWSFTYSTSLLLNDAKVLNIPTDKLMKHECQQLTALVFLDYKKGDLSFQEGPLESSVRDMALPSFIQFSPEVNITGSQNYIVIGFGSGDIIKCNLTKQIKLRFSNVLHIGASDFTSSSDGVLIKGNKIGQAIEAELFRSHRCSISSIHFNSNVDNIVSVDENLNICIWEHSKDYISGFNWFTPLKKFKLIDSEETIFPSGEIKVHFEDEIALKVSKKSKKRKGKAVIEKERQDVMAELRALRINQREPYESDDVNFDADDEEKPQKKKNKKFVTKTYSPLQEEIVDRESDQLFHIVTKHKDNNIVVKYATQTYSPGSLQATTLISVKPNFNGSKLYFMLLFDKFPPKIKRHITWVNLDTVSMEISQSSVLKFNISQTQFNMIKTDPHTADFCLSKIFRTSYTEYIFANIAGTLNVFSVFSGRQVLETPEVKKYQHDKGLKLSSKLGKFYPRCQVNAFFPSGPTFYAIITPKLVDYKSATSSGILKFVDDSVLVYRKSLEEAKDKILAPINLQGVQQTQSSEDIGTISENDLNCDLEQTFSHEGYTVRDLPIQIYIQMMLYSVLDNAVAIGCGMRMTKAQRSVVWKQDWSRMQKSFLNQLTEDEMNE